MKYVQSVTPSTQSPPSLHLSTPPPQHTKFPHLTYEDLWKLINPLEYTAGCKTVWAIDVFAFISSFLSVDGMTSYTVLKLKK
jgi:hypothetical protein